jgi:hypothetical protein
MEKMIGWHFLGGSQAAMTNPEAFKRKNKLAIKNAELPRQNLGPLNRRRASYTPKPPLWQNNRISKYFTETISLNLFSKNPRDAQ